MPHPYIGAPFPAALPDHLQNQLSQTLGSAYTVERELGGGGMSRVYVAEEVRLKRKVVVKVLSPELAAGVSADRFEREIQLAAGLQQANIVPLLSAGDTDGLPYYMMPFIDGLSLRARLARNGAMPVAEVVSVLRDVARALSYAHEHGIVHRDIKPENILLSGDAAVVTDFGIAKALSASRTQAPGGTLTQVGTSIGTPAYMAPEQAAGDPNIDHRADLYALGCVAFEMLTGAPPFHDRPMHQIFAAHMTEAPVNVATKRRDAPKSLASLVMRCLEKDVTKRPQSAREVLQSLDTLTSGESSPARKLPRLWPHALVVTAVAVLFVMLSGTRRSNAPVETDRSIAVLPFSNAGNDSAQNYFAEGIADELTTALAKIPGLRVASRSAAFATAKKSASAQDAGRTLKVGTVLEGSIRRSGKRMRIAAQLTNVSDGFALWSDAFDRDTGDVFTVQDELSRRIATALHDKLSMSTVSTTASMERGTQNQEAYDLYLRGRYFWQRRGETGLRKAASLFSQAIAKDPKFARGLAGLALVQVVLPEYIAVFDDTLIDAGVRSAERAIAIDPDVADGHLALAYAMISKTEWERSESEFKRAMALEPNNPAIHHWYSDLLLSIGRVPEAVQQITLAQQLDPTSSVIASELAFDLADQGKYPEAIAIGRRSIELDTLLGLVYGNLAFIHMMAGHPDTALALLERERLVSGLVPRDQAAWILALAQLGRTAEARKATAELDVRVKNGTIGWYWSGFAHAAIGEDEIAMQALTRATDLHQADIAIQSVACDPTFTRLHKDARFGAILKRLKLGECVRI